MRYSLKEIVIGTFDYVAPRKCYSFRCSSRLLRYHEPEVYLIPRFCKGGTSIDVGAAFGEYSFQMSKYSRQVHLFEARRALAEYLEPRVPKNVCVHNLALSDREGLAMLRVPTSAGGLATIEATNRLDSAGPIKAQTIPTRSLDDFGFSDIDFIKVDVIGHEAAVLRGATNTLQRCRPVMQVEIEARRSSAVLAVESLKILEEMEYKGFWLKEGKLRPIDYGEVDFENNRAGKRFVINFLFICKRSVQNFSDILSV